MRSSSFLLPSFLAILLLTASGISPALAGGRPQVDLSIDVSVTPDTFVPGGVSTVTLRVHNAGPDVAGGVVPGWSFLEVFEKPYNIVDQPPPFIVPEPGEGCTVYVEESEYIPGEPGGGITLMWSYWFDPIGPGETRICTYRAHMLETTTESFDTYWRVHTAADDDTNPDNNRVDYTFVAAPRAAAVPVPGLSATALIVLGMMLAWAAMTHRKRGRSCWPESRVRRSMP